MCFEGTSFTVGLKGTKRNAIFEGPEGNLAGVNGGVFLLQPKGFDLEVLVGRIVTPGLGVLLIGLARS